MEVRRVLTLTVLAGLAVAPVVRAQEAGPAVRAADVAPVVGATVQLAILLDTSNSMDGLIQQAKSQLWSIVNEFAMSKKGGTRPALRVALYEYGNDRLSAGENHIRQVLPLTDDLDAVSEKLFALTTDGGNEFCGAVVDAATKGLEWSNSADDLRIIVVAGNEPFTQGGVDFKSVVPAAVRKGLIVNTIFCGNRQEGEQSGWLEGARLGEGTYSVIDQNSAAPHIPAPQDTELSQLSTQINATYLPYGAEGEAGCARQIAQDTNAAAAAPSAPADRAASKASGFYTNASWDLVDAVKEKQVKLEDVGKDELPKEFQGLPKEECARRIDALWESRQEIQKKIQSLDVERQKFITAKLREMSGPDESFGAALLAALRNQAKAKGYTFETK